MDLLVKCVFGLMVLLKSMFEVVVVDLVFDVIFGSLFLEFVVEMESMSDESWEVCVM